MVDIASPLRGVAIRAAAELREEIELQMVVCVDQAGKAHVAGKIERARVHLSGASWQLAAGWYPACPGFSVRRNNGRLPIGRKMPSCPTITLAPIASIIHPAFRTPPQTIRADPRVERARAPARRCSPPRRTPKSAPASFRKVAPPCTGNSPARKLFRRAEMFGVIRRPRHRDESR